MKLGLGQPDDEPEVCGRCLLTILDLRRNQATGPAGWMTGGASRSSARTLSFC